MSRPKGSPNKVKPDQDKPVGPPAPKLISGFAVLIDEDGGVYVERDQKVLAVKTSRETSLIEVRRYLSEILMDLQAQAAAEYTTSRFIGLQEAAARAAVEAQNVN